MKFTIKGREYDLSREKIQETMRHIEPKGQSKYMVEINGIVYPAKQVIEVLTGLPPLAFTTSYAYRILDKLGYDVIANCR